MDTPDKSQPSIYTEYDCPKCKRPIKSYIGAQAQYIACPSCQSLFRNNFGILIFHAKFKRALKSIIPLGYKGRHKDKNFQMVAASEVKESSAAYYWREYILKYEDGTYGYLSEYEGHWSYGEQIYDVNQKRLDNDIVYKKDEYKFFNFYKTVHVAAIGEFLWDVADLEKPKIHEYIDPPYGLICELKKHETNWFRTEYLEKKDVQKILGSGIPLPKKYGSYSIQPFNFPLSQHSLIMLSLIFLAVMAGITTFIGYTTIQQKIYTTNQSILSVIPDSGTVTSEPFKVTSLFNSTALDVELVSNVNNNWFEASCTLINETTGQEYYFDNGVEYWAGADYTEGSNNNTVTLSEIPDGTYRMVMKPGFEASGSHPDYYTITVTQGVLLWSNFILLSVVVLLIPLGIWLYAYNFNTSKWSQSNVV